MKDKTVVVHDKNFKIFIEEQDIQNKIKTLADLITSDYKDKNPVFIAVLTGSFLFAADVMKHINFPCEVYFIKVSSYVGLSSSGSLKLELDIESSKIKDRTIIIIEDIIETGLTITSVKNLLKQKGALSVEVLSLLVKPTCLKCEMVIKYIGFEISDLFVVGYGLDYNQSGRNLNDIYQIVNE